MSTIDSKQARCFVEVVLRRLRELRGLYFGRLFHDGAVRWSSALESTGLDHLLTGPPSRFVEVFVIRDPDIMSKIKRATT